MLILKMLSMRLLEKKLNFPEFLVFCTLKGIVEDTGTVSKSGITASMNRVRIENAKSYAIIVHQGDEILTSNLFKQKDDPFDGYDEFKQPSIKHLMKVFSDDT